MMKPAINLRPPRHRPVPGLRPDRAFRPLPDEQAAHFDLRLAPAAPLTADEAELWDEIAGPCCYAAPSPAIRLGLHRDGGGRYHVRGCDAGTGQAMSLAEAAKARTGAGG